MTVQNGCLLNFFTGDSRFCLFRFIRFVRPCLPQASAFLILLFQRLYRPITSARTQPLRKSAAALIRTALQGIKSCEIPLPRYQQPCFILRLCVYSCKTTVLPHFLLCLLKNSTAKTFDLSKQKNLLSSKPTKHKDTVAFQSTIQYKQKNFSL